MTKCLLCGGPVKELFRANDYRRPDDPTEWPLDWCAKCEFGRLRGHFTPSIVSSFYQTPEYYTHGGKPAAEEPSLSFLDRVRMHIAWRIDASAPLDPSEVSSSLSTKKTFLDLGCGAGEQLKQFKAAGYQVVGIEPDPVARERASEFSAVYDGTAEILPVEVSDRQFTLVLMSHVLEHCIDPLIALTNVRKVMASDSTLIIEVPNNNCAGFFKLKAIWPWADIPRHLNFFSEPSLNKILKLAGFKTAKVIYTGYTRQFSPTWVDTEKTISKNVRAADTTNFNIAAWQLLLRTALAGPQTRYDSIRVHAVPSNSQSTSNSVNVSSDNALSVTR